MGAGSTAVCPRGMLLLRAAISLHTQPDDSEVRFLTVRIVRIDSGIASLKLAPCGRNYFGPHAYVQRHAAFP
ncbi:unannotated protein [freshwater metagenome]|uniref:Unannotated protein n=1 Tax=freshwater metagenome TaxID=449393 RepID=A0A6J7SFI2_9ZZZZ